MERCVLGISEYKNFTEQILSRGDCFSKHQYPHSSPCHISDFPMKRNDVIVSACDSVLLCLISFVVTSLVLNQVRFKTSAFLSQISREDNMPVVYPDAISRY